MNLYKHGIAVMRAQPLHYGHVRIIERMLQECEKVTIVLGSVQESRTDKNPFTFTERLKMLGNIFPFKIHVVGVEDINMPKIWVPYILGKIALNFSNLPIPDVYYAGTKEDAELFDKSGIKTVINTRDDLSGTKIRDMMFTGSKDWKLQVPKINIPIIEQYLTARG